MSDKGNLITKFTRRTLKGRVLWSEYKNLVTNENGFGKAIFDCVSNLWEIWDSSLIINVPVSLKILHTSSRSLWKQGENANKYL